MSEREEILKEMIDSVGDEIGKELVTQKVEHFMKYGNIFLFFEVMNLRREIEIMKGRAHAPSTPQQIKR
ncbi:MAG: hypothetical protein JSV57_00585 [Candidatus Bathyarchaeota archaeon]|nr:MAG: hypothetical protein JSV57_00585 [Candidatus Bathyarchaeota archaeon]